MQQITMLGACFACCCVLMPCACNIGDFWASVGRLSPHTPRAAQQARPPRWISAAHRTEPFMSNTHETCDVNHQSARPNTSVCPIRSGTPAPRCACFRYGVYRHLLRQRAGGGASASPMKEEAMLFARSSLRQRKRSRRRPLLQRPKQTQQQLLALCSCRTRKARPW